ncbi:MAG: hypothetical protein R2702_02580 [Acidimicrobiales bacterium]
MSAAVESEGSPRVVRVLPDVAAIDKEFDYLVPDGTSVELGDVVRIELHGRRVGGWVVGVDVVPEPGVRLKLLAKVSGRGPEPELLELAGWASWRWAGRRASFLRTAAPPGVARFARGTASIGGPRSAGSPADADLGRSLPHEDLLGRARQVGRAVVRLGPGADRYPLVLAAVRSVPGQVLVLCPSVDEAQQLGRRLRRDGVRTAIVAADRPGSAATGEWVHAATTAQAVVGSRAGAWAPAPRLGLVLVLDEHDEASHQQEQAPTWHERRRRQAPRRAGVPMRAGLSLPQPRSARVGELVEAGRGTERGAWPRVEVVDQRDLDPSLGPLFSPRLVDLVRGGGRVLCILNRTGRARLLSCTTCRTIARCEVCDAAVGIEAGTEEGLGALSCGRCGATRPPVCLECGGAGFKNLRLGVSCAREELEALAGTAVGEVTASTPDDDPAILGARVLVGTERCCTGCASGRGRLPRHGPGVARPALPGGRAGDGAGGEGRSDGGPRGRSDGRVLVQARTPDHPVLVAARRGDPARLVASELPLRRALGLPPTTAMALVSGPAAPDHVAALGHPLGVRVQGPLDGTWRLIAADHPTLCDALASVERPPGRLRIEVDPLRA